MNFTTPDLCDKHFDNIYIPEITFKSFGKQKVFSGPITTVKIYNNYNDIFMNAIETAKPGSVIVLDGVQSKPCAWMGDRKAGIAADRGIAGIVINGYIRDVEGLSKTDIGILALGSHPLASRFEVRERKQGARDTTLYFGQVDWIPGHFVYVDKNGVVVSEQNLL